MNPAISIIVPVWNASETLSRCVNSVISQTFCDWELLLSNDGSTDSSLEMCRTLSGKYERIRVIDNPHRGVSETRNAALDQASGEYVCFIDADDLIDPDYLATLYELRDYDLVVSGYWVDKYDSRGSFLRQEAHIQLCSTYSFDDKSKMKELFASGIMHMNWNKLFKREIIEQNHIRYRSFPINEDFIFMLQYLLHCKCLYVVEKATYHWIRVENQQSGVESVPDNLIEIYNEAHQLLRQFFVPANCIADEIMYYSYELVLLKYMRAIKRGALLQKDGADKLKEFHNNDLVKLSFAAHHPKSLGECFYFWLLRLGLYKVYSLLM